MWSVLEATGELQRVQNAKEAAVDEQNQDATKAENSPASGSSVEKEIDVIPTLKELQKAFVDGFANEPREPEEAIEPSVKGALFWRNDQRLLSLFQRRPGNLIDRLALMTDDGSVADELYLSVFSRLPTEAERDDLVALLKTPTENRDRLLGNVAWSFVASAEFFVNH
jgi:hypothetical protein